MKFLTQNAACRFGAVVAGSVGQQLPFRNPGRRGMVLHLTEAGTPSAILWSVTCAISGKALAETLQRSPRWLLP